MTDSVREAIRAVIRDHGRLPVDVDTLADDDDLFQAGMSSHASVNVMLALEDEFEVEFPEAMLRKSTFESIAAISTALGELAGPGQPLAHDRTMSYEVGVHVAALSTLALTRRTGRPS